MFALEDPAWIALPSPISTNALFANLPGRGRQLTREYRAWKAGAGKALASQRFPRYSLPVQIAFYIGEKGIGQMDADNTLKAYIDALKEAGCIRDDNRKWLRSISATWVPGMSGCIAHVQPAAPSPTLEELTVRIARGLRSLLT